MAGIAYEELARRLTPEGRAFFCEMIDAYMAAGSGDRLFIRSDTASSTGMIFTGSGARRDWRNFDSGAIDDLATSRPLPLGYNSRGTPNYRISGEGVHFHRWLMNQEGGAITQTEESVQRVLSGDAFAEKHPA